jgi:hypothetical protein
MRLPGGSAGAVRMLELLMQVVLFAGKNGQRLSRLQQIFDY